MKSLLFSLLMLFSSNVFAGKSLHAHEHGSISLEATVEGKEATFSIDGPAEAFIGFEYLPKSAKEKKVFEDAKNLWTKNFFELVSFEKAAECKIAESTFEQILEEKEAKGKAVHSEIEASAKVTCVQDLKGEKVTINLKKHFKNIKKLKLELIGNETKSIAIKTESFQTTL